VKGIWLRVPVRQQLQQSSTCQILSRVEGRLENDSGARYRPLSGEGSVVYAAVAVNTYLGPVAILGESPYSVSSPAAVEGLTVMPQKVFRSLYRRSAAQVAGVSLQHRARRDQLPRDQRESESSPYRIARSTSSRTTSIGLSLTDKEEEALRTLGFDVA
jgi:hypothetical protein